MLPTNRLVINDHFCRLGGVSSWCLFRSKSLILRMLQVNRWLSHDAVLLINGNMAVAMSKLSYPIFVMSFCGWFQVNSVTKYRVPCSTNPINHTQFCRKLNDSRHCVLWNLLTFATNSLCCDWWMLEKHREARTR